jgi:hypothetical protein
MRMDRCILVYWFFINNLLKKIKHNIKTYLLY